METSPDLSYYVLPKAMLGYEEGTILRDVPLREARAMECNRCGDCCNGLSDDVKRDEATGLPLFVWGSNAPEDLYAERYGQRLLQPIVMGDGGPAVGKAFEIDADGVPYTAFKCSQLSEPDENGCTSCGLYQDPNPLDISTVRPRNCGDFPVFGLDLDAAIIDGHPYVPATGALPRCTWYGIRVVGPWKNEEAWQVRWTEQQQVVDSPQCAVVPSS